MLVKLRRNWFAPNGEFFQCDQGPVEMPDAWKSQLPTTAQVLEKAEVVEEAAEAEPVVEVKPKK